jgi:hypothetical protein
MLVMYDERGRLVGLGRTGTELVKSLAAHTSTPQPLPPPRQMVGAGTRSRPTVPTRPILFLKSIPAEPPARGAFAALCLEFSDFLHRRGTHVG